MAYARLGAAIPREESRQVNVIEVHDIPRHVPYFEQNPAVQRHALRHRVELAMFLGGHHLARRPLTAAKGECATNWQRAVMWSGISPGIAHRRPALLVGQLTMRFQAAHQKHGHGRLGRTHRPNPSRQRAWPSGRKDADHRDKVVSSCSCGRPVRIGLARHRGGDDLDHGAELIVHFLQRGCRAPWMRAHGQTPDPGRHTRCRACRGPADAGMHRTERDAARPLQTRRASWAPLSVGFGCRCRSCCRLRANDRHVLAQRVKARRACACRP
jgi:hypothetical protein